MNTFKSFVRSVAFASALAVVAVSAADAAPKKDFKVAWSIYVGWMPWGYAADNGIVKKWADKYGITIEVKQFNDYVESINQYTAGAYDARHHHQHGCSVDPGRRRRGHHSRDCGRLLQRQRCCDPEEARQIWRQSRARRSIWLNFRSRITCWRVRSKARSSRRRTLRSSIPPTRISLQLTRHRKSPRS